MASESSTLRPGLQLTLDVEKPVSGGRMLARHEGQVVLVADAIPGERVLAQITQLAKGVAFADTVQVLTASADRRPGFSDAACGGMVYSHIDYARQLSIKSDIVADGLMRIGRLKPAPSVAVAGSPTDGYRMRGRLHGAHGRLGFFREGTHQVCEVRNTRQLLDATCDVLDALAVRLSAIGGQSIRELELSENVDASARAVHLLSSDPLPPSEVADVVAISGLTGVVLSAPTQLGGAPVTTLVAGDPYVVDRLALDGVTIAMRRHVQSFFQGNRYLLRDLVAHVTRLVPIGQRVTDLYAGVGLFAAAAAAARDAVVTAVEGDPFAARDLEVNASMLRVSGASSDGVKVAHRSVERYLASRPVAADCVILDPPRTGLSPEALRGLIALAAPRVVYVSCDVATLARDVRKLAEAGYQTAGVDAFDLFPNTAHIETVVLMTR